jgi:hypothetical protein
MKVYLVWEWEKYECAEVIKVFLEEDKANDFIKYRDKMTGNFYRVEEKEVTA